MKNVMENKYLVTFAGAVGSSKTPIAHYISWKCNLPILSNDVMRTEVIEDVGFLDDAEYLRRRDDRLNQIAESGGSFIYDASVDREWSLLESMVGKYDYQIFIISLDLSKDFLLSLYKSKEYDKALVHLDRYLSDHENFLNNHGDLVGINITDGNFRDRLQLCLTSVKEWLAL
ncbi:MAG: hypothetical protein Q7S66_03615 [bacterium]|nr:hypothetical protein [bacterium]